ncbi:thymidylate synthase (FAD) [Dethiosulfatibacter aminovorans DSM 17477]|uniref:Flavin-dependent thymidylate synthase n=1 Tax=Dethiosulfatibacter aminovorans DSM 17477 TaxID=1121476 RepID=A0A1M6CYA4_9FIRM|nr:FAD-dependent thymidylate synthase [Dethiosulfatibacter aminovorans]SHI65853.1 thymidylate synthase (FAD) [Dethiosulfatibacter aminovorans DSM 17477]
MKTELRVKLVQYTPEPEKLVAAAAKLCYSPLSGDEIMNDLDEENTEKFINMLMKLGHQSPVEHINFSFAIEGVSRTLTHQLVRHRLASYSQRSQRYVTEGQFQYIIPPEIEKNSAASAKFIEAMEYDQKVYDEITDLLYEGNYKRLVGEGKSENAAKSAAEKKAIEDARYVLPNACETKIMVTMNARNLIHFFSVRCCNRAQWEIREMASQMLREAHAAAPNIFSNCGPACVAGPCPEGKMSCGKIEEMREKYSYVKSKKAASPR